MTYILLAKSGTPILYTLEFTGLQLCGHGTTASGQGLTQ
jgi:hypothetical protein